MDKDEHEQYRKMCPLAGVSQGRTTDMQIPTLYPQPTGMCPTSQRSVSSRHTPYNEEQVRWNSGSGPF